MAAACGELRVFAGGCEQGGPVSADAIQRGRGTVLPGWTLHGIRIRRIRSVSGICSDDSGQRREVANIYRGRQATDVARGRKGTVLRRRRSEERRVGKECRSWWSTWR